MGEPSRTASPRRRGSASWSHTTLRLVRAPCRVAPRPRPLPPRARGQDLSSHTPDAAAAGPRRGAPFGPPEWPLHFLHPRWRCRFPARALSPRSCASQTPRSPASRPRAWRQTLIPGPPSPGPVLSASLLPWVPPQTDSALLLLSPLPRVYRLGHPSHPAASPAPTWGRLGGCAERPRSLCSQRPLAARSPFLLSSYPRSPQNQANSSARLSPHSHPSPRR